MESKAVAQRSAAPPDAEQKCATNPICAPKQPKFNKFLFGKFNGFESKRPSNFPNATIEPVKVTPPEMF